MKHIIAALVVAAAPISASAYEIPSGYNHVASLGDRDYYVFDDSVEKIKSGTKSAWFLVASDEQIVRHKASFLCKTNSYAIHETKTHTTAVGREMEAQRRTASGRRGKSLQEMGGLAVFPGPNRGIPKSPEPGSGMYAVVEDVCSWW